MVTDADSSDGSSRIQQQIREISLRIFEALNHGKLGDPILQNLTPDYHMTCENSPGPYTSSDTREAFLQHYREMLEMNPDYYFNITECSVKLSDSNRRATVVMTGDTNVGARPTTMRIEVVNLLSWEWRKQEVGSAVEASVFEVRPETACEMLEVEMC